MKQITGRIVAMFDHARTEMASLQSLDQWRQLALHAVLWGITVAALPVLYLVLERDSAPFLRATYLGSYTLVLVMLVVPRRHHHLRVAGFMAAGYLLLPPAMINLGLAATIRIMLVELPIVATLLGGRRLGGWMLLLSIAMHGAFVALAYLGWLPPPRAQQFGLDWATHGLIMVVGLVPLMVLLERALAFQEGAIARIRSDTEHLAEAALERERLEREVIEATERDRRLVGQELHDGLCQQLTSGLLAARMLERDLIEMGSGEAQQAAALAEITDAALSLARGLAHGLRPGPMPVGGLDAALRELARQVRETRQVDCNLVGSGAPSLSGPRALQLYRIAQEATQNAVRHAEATCVTLELSELPGSVRLSVRDDGRGISAAAAASPGTGMASMRERALALGGSFEIRAAKPTGTEVCCEIELLP